MPIRRCFDEIVIDWTSTRYRFDDHFSLGKRSTTHAFCVPALRAAPPRPAPSQDGADNRLRNTTLTTNHHRIKIQIFFPNTKPKQELDGTKHAACVKAGCLSQSHHTRVSLSFKCGINTGAGAVPASRASFPSVIQMQGNLGPGSNSQANSPSMQWQNPPSGNR